MFKTKGIIINRRGVGEADQLLDVLTEKFGKLNLLARGSRKQISKLNPHLQLFCESEIIFVDGKKNKVLTSALLINRFDNLRHNVANFKAADYGTKLVRYFTFDSSFSHADFYPLFKGFLSVLDESPASRNNLILRYFEYGLLGELGFKPHFETCVNCGSAGVWRVSFVQGGRICNNCRAVHESSFSLSDNTARFLESLASGYDHALGAPPNEVLEESSRILRTFFNYHVQKISSNINQ